PVDVVTGACIDCFVDYPGDDGLGFERFYSSLASLVDGPVGRGFRHGYQRELLLSPDRISYVDGEREGTECPAPPPGGEPWEAANNGYRLRRLSEHRYQVFHLTAAMEFEFEGTSAVAALRALAHEGDSLELEYAGERLSLIRDSIGRSLRFDY